MHKATLVQKFNFCLQEQGQQGLNSRPHGCKGSDSMSQINYPKSCEVHILQKCKSITVRHIFDTDMHLIRPNTYPKSIH